MHYTLKISGRNSEVQGRVLNSITVREILCGYSKDTVQKLLTFT